MRRFLSKNDISFRLRIWHIVFFVGLTCCLVDFSGVYASKPVKVSLADNGHALHSVVVANGALERTREAAKDLAEYLGRITGGDFEIKQGDGTIGIAVGGYKDFPALGLDNLFNPEDLIRRDEYLLRTHDKGVYLVGATDLAAQHAVWDFLYRIGYRQFFPTDTWEFIPENSDLSVEMDVFEQPDYYNRYGPRTAAWSDNNLWDRWHDRNRMTSSFILNTGHSYGGIISRNQAAFDQHPEYYAMVDGKRQYLGGNTKFCISNENLRHLVVEDAKIRIKDNPNINSISLDPSDGGNWCECEACAEMGSVSDRVVILANEVAEGINELGYGEKYVGIYAYNQHSPPPNINVHPNVIVSIATSFIRGGYTFEGLIEGWSEHAKILGIREYYATFVWDQGMPRKGKGGNISYLAEKIPYYYEKGARFMNANSTDAWVAYGLGYYLSARLLWDTSAAGDVEGLIDDFVDKMFGKGQEAIRNFYEVIAGDYDTPRTNEDLLAHMYGYIKEARGLIKDPEVLARLDDMVLYTRYVELWFRFERAEGQNARDKAAQDVFRHAYRMQNTMMVDAQALYRHFKRYDISIPDYANPRNLVVGQPLEDREPWKSSNVFIANEIEQFIEDGVAAYKKDNMEFLPVSYSEDLVPAAAMLGLPEVSTGDMGRGDKFRHKQKMFTWFWPDNKLLSLHVTGGLIEKYRDRGNVRFKLFSPKEALVEPVDTDEGVPPDGETYNIALKSPYEGMHELEWDDGGDQTRVVWTEGTHMTVRSSMNDPAKSLQGNRRLYFYVPKGTKIVGGFTSGNRNHETRVHDGFGNQVFVMSEVEGEEGYFSIPVPEGQDGKLWSFRRAYGTQVLMTVPPYLARNEKELLLPREVVEADKVTSTKNLPHHGGDIKVYPNPARETIYIQMEDMNEEITGIDIYNSVGTKVNTLHGDKINVPRMNIDIQHFSPGLYTFRFKLKGRLITKKIIIG